MLPALFLASLALDGKLVGTLVGPDDRPAAGVRVIIGELGHATLIYNHPKGLLLSTPAMADSEALRWSADRVSGDDGRFEVTGLRPGDYTLLAADEVRGLAFTTVTLKDDATAEVRLRLETPAFCDVDVRGLGFDPATDVLELRPIGTTLNLTLAPMLTRDKGSWGFRSTALPPRTSWHVVGTRMVLAQDYRATLFDVPVTVAPSTLVPSTLSPSNISPGATARTTLALDAGDVVEGVVLGPDGAGVRDVSVVATSGGVAPRSWGAISDAQGHFRIRALDRGRWQLEARRWTMRELAGCGNGQLEFSASASVDVPLATSIERPIELHVARVPPPPKLGEPAPTFEVDTIDGKRLALSSFRGKVVVLDFWATWCGMCRMELNHLAATYEELGHGARFEIVGVSVDEDPAYVKRFVAARNLRWPQTALGLAGRNEIARLYNVNSTPMTVVIDRNGVVAAIDLTGDELRAKIVELLAAK